MDEKERPVPPISAWYIDDHTPNQIIQTTLAHRQRLMAAITSGQTGPPFGPPLPSALPAITLKAFIVPGERTREGVLIEAVAVPWFEILDRFHRDPRSIYEIDDRMWEEIIAGAYKREMFDEVILTPRSGDKGRDVVATKWGVGSIRIFDQVRAYAPDNLVTAEQVRAMLGVITGAQNVSKGIITTTSHFAPRITSDEYLAPYIPFRLELKDRDALLPWLHDLSKLKG
jgi:restriction system protein